MEIYDLRTEGRQEPLGIDAAHPAFSWKIRGEDVFQQTYRIRVDYSEEAALSKTGEAWDSGTIVSDATSGVCYEGTPLKEHGQYVWTVEVNGALSSPARFEVSYLGEPMPCARWIGMPLSYAGGTDVVRLDFSARKPVRRARFYVAALGTGRCYCNGKLAEDSYFNGSVSVYRKKVYYSVYAPEIREGRNALCMEIGYGFYGAKKMKGELFVEYADGSCETVPTVAGRLWNVTGGAVTENSIYGGEVYDARRERDWFSPDYAVSTSEFVAAYCTDAPEGKLCSNPLTPVAVSESFAPLYVRGMGGGRYLADTGKNISGRLKITVRAERGAKITLRYAEIISGESRVNRANLRTAKSRDVYIAAGKEEETYAPCFTYHGFRYAEIVTEGNVEILGVTAQQMRTAVTPAGEFACSDECLSRLHEMAFLTEANNLHGVFTDCPQRDERLGWLNDLSSRVFESVCNFDLSVFLPNFVDMISDSQDDTGAFGDTVPFTVGSDTADAVDAFQLLALVAYGFYGDRRVLEKNYESFCRWNEKLAGFVKGGVCEWGIYGDWCPAFAYSNGGDGTHSAMVTPKFMGAAYYLWNLSLTQKIAEILGKNEDAERWGALFAEGKRAFFEKYVKDGVIGGGSQTECAVAMTIFPEESELCKEWAKRAAEDLRARGYHTTCGNQGYRHLFYRLAEAGYAEELCRLLLNKEYPGWGYMLEQGATTVWERWESDVGTDMHSFDHPMFAAYDGFLFNYLAGIRTKECENAFQKIVVEPCFVKCLQSVSASLETVRGKISVRWERTGKTIVLSVDTPANTRLVVRAAGKELCMNGRSVRDGIELTNGKFIIEIGECDETNQKVVGACDRTADGGVYDGRLYR